MKDPWPLFVARDPVELESAQALLLEARIVFSLRQPTSSGADVGFGTGSFPPALFYVDRADLERARAVLEEVWGPLPEIPGA